MSSPVFADAPTAYLRANGLLNKAPIYIVSFGAIVGPLGTNYQPLPDEYTTGRVLNATKSRKAIMGFPSGYSSEFNPITYQSTLSNLTFDLQDNNPQYPGEATRLITNYTLKNRFVTIKRGFQGVSEVDYTIIYVGQVNDIYMNQSLTGFTIELIDPRKMMTNTIMDGHTGLVSDYVAGGSTISVADVSYFPPQTSPLAGSCCTCYIRMGSNIYEYSGLNSLGTIQDGTAVWTWQRAGGATHPATAAWEAGHVYNAGDYVYSNGSDYKALNAGGGTSTQTDAPTGTGTFVADTGQAWQWSGYNNTDYLQWYPNKSVGLGNVCTNGGNQYVCTTPGTTWSPVYTANNPPWVAANPSTTQPGGPGGPMGRGLLPVLANLSNGGIFTGLANVNPDGQGDATDHNESVGANVDNFVLFHGHPIDIILGILMSTGSNGGAGGTNADPSGTLPNYDVNPQTLGIGIPWYQVNISNFLAQKTLMGDMIFHGYFQDSEQALKFIENYVLQPAHLAVYTNRRGQIDCRAVFATMDMTTATTLDKTNIVDIPNFKANLQTGGYFYNEPYIHYDFYRIQNYYANYYYEVGDSWQDYQEVSTLPVDGQFLNSAYSGTSQARVCVDTYNARFKRPPPVITCKTFDVFSLLDPFAPVIVDHPMIPNYLTGKRGGPIDCQVVKAEPDWSTGAMTLTLMAIGWYQKQSHPVAGVFYSGDYTTSGDLTVHDLVIMSGITVTISAGDTITITP